MADEINQAEPEENTEVTDLNQFITLLGNWHSKRVKRLEEMLKIPDGTEVSMGASPPFALTGDALKGFQVGVALCLSQLGTLPFSAEYETPPDAPIQ